MMTPERTHIDRAISADSVLTRYSGVVVYQDYHISDLLCDLHHLADERGANWLSLLRRANRHYEAGNGGE